MYVCECVCFGVLGQGGDSNHRHTAPKRPRLQRLQIKLTVRS